MNKTKRAVSVFLALLLVLLLSACGGGGGKTELVVFAAASLEETLTELGEAYMADRGGVDVLFNFDSSGTLRTQIQEGADCDLFLSAGQAQMDQLEELDMVLSDTRVDLLENKVALAVPEGNPARIGSFGDLKSALEEGAVLLAMGGGDVPVGQYTQQILAHLGLDEAALAASGCITYGSNVKEVAVQVGEGTVDCGVIYSTDALSAGLTAVDTATEEMCGQVLYPAAVITAGGNQGGARDFLAFLRTDQASEVFQRAGFTPLR